MPPTDPQVQALLGPGPPEGLSKMGAMRWAAKNPPKDPQASLVGKTVLITGSNTGLGYQAAVKFAAMGASRLILAVRTPSKGEEAKRQIIATVPSLPKSTQILVLPLDMSDIASVKAFPGRLAQANIRTVNVAVLNAGIAPSAYHVNPSTGWEAALQVNLLSTALLAILLMPILKATTAAATNPGDRPAHLTLTGSFAHLYLTAKDLPSVGPGESVLAAINSPQFFNVETSYAVVKLLTMYVMQGLVRDYAGGETDPEVTVNVACPGLCSTELGRDFPWYVVLPTKLMHMYCARSAEEGSRALVSSTLLGRDGHGKFWSNDVLAEPGVMVTSEEGKILQQRVWSEIKEFCKAQLD
ncbi:NAD(P)-binding protein [Aspergillus saccharolyticus JOP 1030-1]|uniref:NAD(P)-binding protein n=1 Tax=Aspergillus saccharolyticus JOP 1030-1 TaxID=1450539 RepID=A0A318Z5P2_9EURO|nr:NAD(P)-binding protein [Aspergillus saccharolyticus JOP 1030-1]PYH42436.1 NAD(P)-binding protein [Aspergillus saccharolyticus JOP 1030-1]